ncbi:hypothetical protein MGWOODY_Clf1642 [hydrothermal vent metagenome]|uniref:Uncharacterized protein n=1 Tax=hydrothermal vent metagenome TaxID=652676 RepID=A0A160V7B6_9ZZZZ
MSGEGVALDVQPMANAAAPMTKSRLNENNSMTDPSVQFNRDHN